VGREEGRTGKDREGQEGQEGRKEGRNGGRTEGRKDGLTERRKDGCKGTLGMTDVVGRGGPPGSACSKIQHWPIAKINVSQSKEKTLPSRLGRVSPFFYKKLSPLGFAYNNVHCDIPASYSSSSSSSSSSSPSSLRKGCDRCRVHFAIRSGSFRCSAFNDRPELINLVVF